MKDRHMLTIAILFGAFIIAMSILIATSFVVEGLKRQPAVNVTLPDVMQPAPVVNVYPAPSEEGR